MSTPVPPTPRWPAPQEDVPVDLRRGRHRDRILRALDFAVSARVKWLATVHGGGRRTRRIDEYRSRLLVADRTTVARDKDVVSVTLRAPDGSNLPQWHPGAHLDLE